MLQVLTCIAFEEIGVFLEVGTSFPPFSADHQRHMTAPHGVDVYLGAPCLLGNLNVTLQQTEKNKEALKFYFEGFVEDRSLRHPFTQCKDP